MIVGVGGAFLLGIAATLGVTAGILLLATT
jgi:hypothetical protein